MTPKVPPADNYLPGGVQILSFAFYGLCVLLSTLLLKPGYRVRGEPYTVAHPKVYVEWE